MSVRKHKSHGKWVWQARVAYQGRRRSVYCATKNEAKDQEAQLLQYLRKEREDASQAEQSPATLRMLLEHYVVDLEQRGKSADTVIRASSTAKMIERATPALLDRAVSAIGDPEIFAFRNARARDGKIVYETVAGKRQERRIPNKPSTINRDLRTLRAALKKARPEYRFPGGAFFPADDTRVRWLRPEEELLVLEPMPTPFREMAKLAALTLMRQGEILGLRPEYVHLEQGVVLLPRAKGGARPVILNVEAQKILRGQLERHEGKPWVFPNPDGEPYSRIHVSRVFRKAARAAGLKDFTFHDLRHHGATMALNAGFTAPVVMALGGWKSEAMMRRYAAVTDRTLRAAAEAVSGTEASLLRQDVRAR